MTQTIDVNFVNKENQQPNTDEYKKPGRKKPLFFLIAVILLLFTGVSIVKALLKTELPNDPNAYDPVTLEPKKPENLFNKIKYFVFSKDVKLEGEKDDRVNILLLGQGGPGHDGPYLTDTIIILSAKPSTNQIAMVSVPRDLGVNIPEQGWWKINHASHFGEINKPGWGGAFATEIISKTFDLEIPYYIRVDFKAFEEIIDEVGGVSVNVERAFTDREFPAPNDQYQTISFSKGIQTLGGGKALQFARSRHGNNGEGSDFARAYRQQQILLALKEKVFSFSTLANPVKINNIMKSLDTHITTNMEFSDILAMIKMAKEMNVKNINTVVLDNSPGGYLVSGTSPAGAYILSPKSGDFKDINNMIKNVFNANLASKEYTPTPQIAPDYSKSKIEIQNGTWVAGLASEYRKKLQDKKFTVSVIGNTEERPQLKSGIYKLKPSSDDTVLEALKEELKIPILKLPENLTFSPETDILVILGTDMET